MPPRLQTRQAPTARARKGHYSCEFCRVRKLRCSRPLPCTNCVSRGKTCVMDAEGPVEMPVPMPTAVAGAVAGPAEVRQTPRPARQYSPSSQTTGTPFVHDAGNQALLDEVYRLRRLAEDLERRIHSGTDASTSTGGAGTKTVAMAMAMPPPLPSPPPLPRPSPAVAPDAMGPMCAVVTHLDRVSMGNGSYADLGQPSSASATGSPSALSSTTTAVAAAAAANQFEQSGLALKIAPILSIPTAPEFSYSIVGGGDRLGAPRRHIHLPLYSETTALIDTFLQTVGSFYHIVHHPTTPALVARVYDRVQRHNGAQLPLGDVLLVVAMIATGTCLHTPEAADSSSSGSYDSNANALFATRGEAARQIPYWIQSAVHLLEAIVRGAVPPTLSALQGVVTLMFLISNVEGVGFRYRYIVSTALMLGRELGLHCIDQDCGGSSSIDSSIDGNNSSSFDNSGDCGTRPLTTPFEKELGRRVWWYVASTDWLLAARNSGPGVGVYQTHPHMMRVREPRNMDDDQLGTASTDPIPGLPLDVPTDMSYLLQRVRLANIARGIVDRMPMVSSTQFVGGPASSSAAAAALLAQYRESALASDAELDAMLRDMPPFLRMETYEQAGWEAGVDGDDNKNSSSNTKNSHGRPHRSHFIQAFMLHSLIHTQRCKLHLSYLTSWRRQTGNYTSCVLKHPDPARRPSVSAASTTSRAVCIDAARQIIHAETQIRRRAAGHPFVQSRLSCVLYGVFLATIVLMIDLCADNGEDASSSPSAVDTRAAFSAMQIVADARPYSPAAAELYTSLTQLLAKHRPQLLEAVLGTAMPPRAVAAMETMGAMDAMDAMDAMETPKAVPPLEATTTTTMPPTNTDFDVSFYDSLYNNPLALHFDGLDNLAQFQWDDLLANVDMSLYV
ncbi:uncharacterized protein SPSK_01018 [Sporothrix schenckii 1099-18]|uniref:Zn(2)-C6 fungal-type domain-containing protein n=1 Tax=Sporothrix schenckii 1099-18 TaxID=1397361 RepID=A0A0F2LVG6_SPOSC|nr:uncharacterized protein SPSK_01018 [Sporothrix schenckii 1099-18]KJR81438.1 hypothetical protein SPSK_01018 [Sporothrix schenckii 1099-18]